MSTTGPTEPNDPDTGIVDPEVAEKPLDKPAT